MIKGDHTVAFFVDILSKPKAYFQKRLNVLVYGIGTVLSFSCSAIIRLLITPSEMLRALYCSSAIALFARCVLENPHNWYNGIIQCRINRSHVVNVPPLMLDI